MTTFPLGYSLASPPPSYSSYITLEEIHRTQPAWAAIARIAYNSVSRIVSGEVHLGCGVLVGIDRMLVPLHVLEGRCLDTLDIVFEVETEEHCYVYTCKAVAILHEEAEHDFCLVQLSSVSATEHILPGHLIAIPGLTWDMSFVETLMVHVTADGCKTLSLSSACPRPEIGGFCSYHPTSPGSSGGACFTRAGLLAIHRAKSTGFCRPAEERSAILISEIAKRCHLLGFSACRPFCPPPVVKRCLPRALPPRDFCYSDEKGGGKSVISDELTSSTGARCRYWEIMPKNAKGGGPRGIRVLITPRSGEALDERLRFNENPHDCRGYNKDQEAFYRTAALAIFTSYERGAGLTPRFKAFGADFTLRFD